jgi:hypothetical protein
MLRQGRGLPDVEPIAVLWANREGSDLRIGARFAK